MPDGSFGTPYSVSEARGAAQKHKDMDQYHAELMLWLCDEVDRLTNLLKARSDGTSDLYVTGDPPYDTVTDADLKATALDMWANHIETGNVVLSAADAASMKKKARDLDPDQRKLVERLRSLVSRERNSEF
jgi:hypothetical protein